MQAKIIISVVFCISCSSGVHAEYDASDLGKLFTDKSQRSQIDAARSGASSSRPRQADKVKVTGYMKRSDGKNVVWINGKNTMDKSKIDDVKVHPKTINDDSKKVPVTIDGRRVNIKPGESWSRSTGKIEENY